MLPARAAGPLRGQRADYWACGCWACSCGRAADRRAAAYRGSPRRAFAPREAEVCVSPLLALAVPLQMDIARGHRRAPLPRASSASQSSATAGCSGRSARQAAARPHCVVTLEARAAPPSGAESRQLECRCPTPRSSSRRASGCACLRRTTPPTTWLTATRDRLPRAARRRPCRRGCSCRHCSTPRSRLGCTLGQYNRIVAVSLSVIHF